MDFQRGAHMEERLTKTCKTCFEQIDERARKCPHCRTLQGKAQGWIVRHPFIFALLCFLPFVLLIALNKYITPNILLRREPQPYTGQIKVVASELAFGESKDGPVVCVIGRLRNDSNIPWSSIDLDAQFLDGNGKVVDVAQDRTYHYMLVDVLPYGECGFKIRGPRDFPKEKYASVKIDVTYAKDDVFQP